MDAMKAKIFVAFLLPEIICILEIVSLFKMNEHSVLLNPKAKSSKPQGQLAAMLQSRGWDENQLIGSEINRSSSAPPTNLRNVSYFSDFRTA
jgi:hypothetical protein